jgi:3D (Asp-Asp-Asp) domain-containing protein
MQNPAARVALLAFCLLAAGCASRSLPKYEKPLARAQFQAVRTTAYTHTEGDHLKYGSRNATGDQLQSGSLKSAACDWSRWPVGTVFRLQETGETFIVDDYGWALAGTNTIDLYKPSRSAMNAWGVRRVNLEILQWGDARRSLSILQPRTKYAHVRRMVNDLRNRYADLTSPFPLAPSPVAIATVPDAPLEPPRSLSVAQEDAAPERAVAVNAPAVRQRTGGFIPGRPVLTPFSAPR